MTTPRRDFLRSTLGASAGWGLGALLSGCARDADSAGPNPSPSSTTLPLPVADPGRPWWLQGNYASVTEEETVLELPVTGELPAQLEGLYVRNGSNPRGASGHWFIGDGMVHGVRLDEGRPAWYRNRWVRTANFADPPEGLTPPGRDRTASNVSLAYHGGRLLSLGEVGFPFEISTENLSTIGMWDFAGRLTTNMTAHPRVHPDTGALHFFGYDFVPPFLTYMVADPSGALTTIEPIDLPRSHMIHDFAITRTHAVFWVLPVVFSLDRIDSGLPYAWDSSAWCKVGVMPLDGTNDDMTWFDVERCMVFHGTNAWDDGDEVVVDVCRLDSAFDDTDLSQATNNQLHRWRLNITTGAVVEQVRSDRVQDFPMTDRRFNGRAHRHTWLTSVARTGTIGLEFTGLVHRDEKTDTETSWDPRGRYGPGEVTFVPRASDAPEGEGWLLTFAHDRTTDRSDLLVFEATALADGPIAAVHLPVRVPYGFHGTWVSPS